MKGIGFYFRSLGLSTLQLIDIPLLIEVVYNPNMEEELFRNRS